MYHKIKEMDVKSYNSAQTFGSGPQFLGQHPPLNSQLGYFVDWHKGPGVGWLRPLVRKRM
jgi:hypothetical protein